jgi:DNA-directed RNA polymerase specialized sigma24 family protein
VRRDWKTRSGVWRREVSTRTLPLTTIADSEVPELRAYLYGYLRRALPAYAQEHDDLVGDALLHLVQYLSAHREELPLARKIGLARHILRARIVDLFRKNARALESVYSDERTPTGSPSAEDVAAYRELLLRCLRVIEQASVEDRAFLLGLTEREGPMDDAGRKRISRLRARLSAHAGEAR